MRYCCEVSVNEEQKRDLIKETQKRYQLVFEDLNAYQIACVNTSSLVAHYHYCLFLYEQMDEKSQAIVALKAKHQEIVQNLDLAYKMYVDCYDVIDVLTTTLTGWVIENNYGGVNELNAM